ncbi:hypothetical protein RV04_GL002317 [Enterococcus hermanniensis]|uniref:CAAX prenyl protease 2/Lysostaphin resistance protein A-like domain-containing protein n=1 Tax=Enterococcus hermanniensis TaxID=249189 RepID=A0A1L8TLQ3_9ENTE|nr:hypothetical protein RV04_GL002317 [Enterococcus hermanniensis]
MPKEHSVVFTPIITELLALLLIGLCNHLFFKVSIPWKNWPKGRQWAGLVPIIVVLLGDSTLNPHFSFGFLAISTAILAGLSVGLFEEYIFRGLLIGFLKKYFHSSNRTMILFSGITFGLLHLSNAIGGNGYLTILQVAMATGIGFFFSTLYLMFNSLWLPIIGHAIVDAFDQLAFQSLENTTGTALGTSLLYLVFFSCLSGYLYHKYLTA